MNPNSLKNLILNNQRTRWQRWEGKAAGRPGVRGQGAGVRGEGIGYRQALKRKNNYFYIFLSDIRGSLLDTGGREPGAHRSGNPAAVLNVNQQLYMSEGSRP